MVKETKYYDMLGVKPDASEADIKKAFRKLALKISPDKCTKEQQEELIQMSKACAILSDQKKRALYDQVGEQGMVEHMNAGGFSDPV